MNILVILQGPAYGDEVGLCGTCMDARGITDTMLVATNTRRSTLDEVTDWKLWADKTITF